MAQIPVQELPGVAPSGRGAPMPQNVQSGGWGAITQGAQQLGQGVGNTLEKAAQEYDRRQEESRKKAIEAEVTEAETEWNNHRTAKKYGRRSSGNARTDAIEGAFNGERVEQPGYFNLQGDDAFKASPETFESIAKKRNELAKNMADEDARSLFLKRTAGDLDNDNAQIEAFAGKQRQVADLATLEARKKSALESVQANPNDWVEVTRQTAALEEPIRKLGLSDVDKEARINEWRREIGVAQVAAQLTGPSKDWEAAQKTLDSKRETIGDAAAKKLQTEIDHVRGPVQAEAAADHIVAASVRPGGKPFELPDLAAAERMISQLPAENGVQEKAATMVKGRLALISDELKRSKADFIDSATAAYNRDRVGFFSTPMAGRLNQVDPDKYRSLVNEIEARWRRIGDDSSAARRDQKTRDDLALLKYRSFGDGDVNARIGLNVDTFAAGMDLSDKGIEAIKAAHAADVAARDKGVDVGQNEFVKKTRAQLEKFAPPVGTSKQSRAANQQWWQDKTAEAINAYTKWQNNNPTKHAPGPEEEAKLRGQVILSQPVDPSRPETLEQNVEALRAIVTPRKTDTAMVPLIGPKGERVKAPADGLDTWLAAHPGWKRR
jgi:hypothetical protein